MTDITVAVVDVRKADDTGWWRLACTADGALTDPGAGGASLEEFVAVVAEDLAASRKVALGFEAPLTVPMPEEAERLGRVRRGESDRPWPVGAGAAALGQAAQQVPWVLMNIGARLERMPKIAWDPIALGADEFGGYYADMIVWEASVYGRAGADADAGSARAEGARAAADEFVRRLASGHVGSEVGRPARFWTPRGRPLKKLEERVVFNLAGAGLLRAGITTDVKVLSEQPWVVRARRSAPRPLVASA